MARFRVQNAGGASARKPPTRTARCRWRPGRVPRTAPLTLCPTPRLKLKCDRTVPCQSCKVRNGDISCFLAPFADVAVGDPHSDVGTSPYAPTVRLVSLLSTRRAF